MRAGEDPTATGDMVAANKKARDEAFARMTALLKQFNSASKASVTAPRTPRVVKASATKSAAPVQCHDMNMNMNMNMSGAM
jgi:hypothetical protein